MPRKKKVTVEIVRRAPTADMDARGLLDRIVQEKVKEILAERSSGQIVPDFQPKETAYEIQRRQNVYERHKWGLYFEKWGCRTCGRKKGLSHMCNGDCSTCNVRTAHRLEQIKREYERSHPEAEMDRQIDRLSSRFRSAEALLGEG